MSRWAHKTDDVSSDTDGSQRHHHLARWSALVVLIATVGLVSGLAAGNKGVDPATLAAVNSPLLGKPAPSFALTEIDSGATVSLASFRGRIVIVNFWASWCVDCVKETPALIDFASRWRTKGASVVGISFNDSVDAARSFQRQWGMPWPLLTDPGGAVALNYGIFGVPETFVVDARGVIEAKLVGAIGRGQLDQIVTRIRQGSAPIETHNKQFQSRP